MQYLSCYQGYCHHGGAEKVDMCWECVLELGDGDDETDEKYTCI